MSDYIKYFSKHSDYTSYNGQIGTPSVIYCEQENEVHYNPKVVGTKYVFVIFNNDTNTSININAYALYDNNLVHQNIKNAYYKFGRYGVNDNPKKTYTLISNYNSITLFAHDQIVVAYELNDNTYIEDYMFYEQTYITEVYFPSTIESIGTLIGYGANIVYHITSQTPPIIDYDAFKRDENYNNSLVYVSDVSLYTNGSIDITNFVNESLYPLFVNLDLPSGTLWSKVNIGAETETDQGIYYSYGDTYFYDDFAPAHMIYSGTEDPLDSEYDIATQSYGDTYHYPTKTQLEELIAETNYEWTTINGTSGMKFTSKVDSSKWIFIPATGYYAGTGPQYYPFPQGEEAVETSTAVYIWSSTPIDETYAYVLKATSSNVSIISVSKICGCVVRPAK